METFIAYSILTVIGSIVGIAGILVIDWMFDG